MIIKLNISYHKCTNVRMCNIPLYRMLYAKRLRIMTKEGRVHSPHDVSMKNSLMKSGAH